APRCELKTGLRVTEKVLTIEKGEGFCQASETSAAGHSPLNIGGKIYFSNAEGLSLNIASKELNGSLLEHFLKLPTSGQIEIGTKIAGPYDKLVVSGEVKSPNLNITGFDVKNLRTNFVLPIAKNELEIKGLTAQIGPSGSLLIDDFTLGLAADLPFSLMMTAKQIPAEFLGEGLFKTTGKPSLSLAIENFTGHLEGRLLRPLQYQGQA
ncbi:MAG: hypothetical protein AAB288_00795, partial [Acidobacteriota bacterium]